MLNQIEKTRLKEEIEASLYVSDVGNARFYISQLKKENPFSENKYDSLYRFGTEDMRSYYQIFKNLNSILTIGASGDQVLNAILMGAKKIDVFDSNPLSKRQVSLKVAASKTLDKKLFKVFFNKFSNNLFDMVKVSLKEDDKNYWESLFDVLGSNEISKNLFPYKILDSKIIDKINPYLDQENYESLKDKINDVEINYIDADLYSLHDYIKDNKYDGINLSNIYEYIAYNVKNREVSKYYRDYLMNVLYPHLEDNGVMLISYLYAFSESVKDYIDEKYKINPSCIVESGAISADKIEDYMKGCTMQNLSYSFLLDAFKNDSIETLKTEHIEYGQSMDMSHDMVVYIRK